MSGPGTTSVSPATGTVLWEHAWPGGAIVQDELLKEEHYLEPGPASTRVS
jgi:hypothetical protein